MPIDLYANGQSVSYNVTDHSGEIGEFAFRTSVFNFTKAQADTAFQPMITGQSRAVVRILHQLKPPLSVIAPASPQSQIEIKWRIIMRDNVLGTEEQILMPTADLSLLPVGSEVLDINTVGSVGQIFKSQMETQALSISGNPVTILAIVLD